MAVSFSNHSLLAPSRLSASSSSSSSSEPFKKILPIHSLHQHQGPLPLKPILGFPPIRINNTRPSFKSFFSTNRKEGFHNETNLKELIEVYKEAIFCGDEKTVSDIEARMCILENEKNELFHKVSVLSAEVTSGKEKFIRLQADFDNFRKRAEKEKLTIRTDAQGEVIESLLHMVDSFESAKEQVKPQTEKEKRIDTSYQGIYKQFVETMRSLQVAAVPTVGKPFDPSMHEAIGREESEEFKEGIVIQECRRGFRLGNRLLRPATVKVSAGPGRKKTPVATQKSAAQPATTAGADDR